MKIIKVLAISIASLIILVGTAFFLVGHYSPKPGGIRIETTPISSVYINGNLVGETPYQNSYKAGKIMLRLVPLGSTQNLIPFETPITLVSGIETVVGRDFGTTEDGSSGYVISFDKTDKDTTGFVAISQPANAQVVVDGVSRGFTPYTVSVIAPAMHTITIKSPGYTDFSMTVRTISGYRLTFYAKLKIEDSQESEQIEDAQKTSGKTVQILDTPTGYLRVRSQPGQLGEEIAQVRPGENFPYLDEDVATGWIQIQYQAPKTGLPSGIVGWISGEYVSVSGGVN